MSSTPYADAYGVPGSLDSLAQWIQWADSCHGYEMVPTMLYNLQQFWAAKAALGDAVLEQDEQWGVLVLDAHAQYLYGYALNQEATGQDTTPAQKPALAQQAQAAYTMAAQEYDEAGLVTLSQSAAKEAGAMPANLSWANANYVDASLSTSVKAAAKDLFGGAYSTLASMIPGGGYTLAAAGILGIILLVKK